VRVKRDTPFWKTFSGIPPTDSYNNKPKEIEFCPFFKFKFVNKIRQSRPIPNGVYISKP